MQREAIPMAATGRAAAFEARVGLDRVAATALAVVKVGAVSQ